MRRLLIAPRSRSPRCLPPSGRGRAANVELLHGTVRAVGHDARGRAAVVRTERRPARADAAQLPHRPRPAGARLARAARARRATAPIDDDYKDLGKLKGNRGNQQYRIPGSVDLRRYRSVIFWCVPFTQTLARANLARS